MFFFHFFKGTLSATLDNEVQNWDLLLTFKGPNKNCSRQHFNFYQNSNSAKIFLKDMLISEINKCFHLLQLVQMHILPLK